MGIDNGLQYYDYKITQLFLAHRRFKKPLLATRRFKGCLSRGMGVVMQGIGKTKTGAPKFKGTWHDLVRDALSCLHQVRPEF